MHRTHPDAPTASRMEEPIDEQLLLSLDPRRCTVEDLIRRFEQLVVLHRRLIALREDQDIMHSEEIAGLRYEVAGTRLSLCRERAERHREKREQES